MIAGGDRLRRRSRMPRVLITGGAGFVGTNLALRLLGEGQPVRILDDLSRPGVERNLRLLEREHGELLDVVVGNVADDEAVARAIAGVDVVFHLAAQVAVTTSLDDPLADAATNMKGTINILEAARGRKSPPAVIFTSTNKVYGSLDDIELVELAERYEPLDRVHRTSGISEDRPLSFCTPYGCSKGAADQYVIDYARSFGVPTCVFRMSCIYGTHQHGNEDQGWVAHMLLSTLADRPITLFGDGKQVRDVLYVDDLVDAFCLARERIDDLAGSAFNIGGGASASVSLRQTLRMIEAAAGRVPQVLENDWRPGDQRWYVSDTSRFEAATGWRPAVMPEDGLARLCEWLADQRRLPDRAASVGAAA